MTLEEPRSVIEIERMDDTSHLQWPTTVRFFVGGPLDGRAIEGADSREWEAGPCGATSDYYADGWLRYESHGLDDEHGWIVYVLDPAGVIPRARKKYISDEIDLASFEEAVGWALAAEELRARDLSAA